MMVHRTDSIDNQVSIYTFFQEIKAGLLDAHMGLYAIKNYLGSSIVLQSLHIVNDWLFKHGKRVLIKHFSTVMVCRLNYVGDISEDLWDLSRSNNRYPTYLRNLCKSFRVMLYHIILLHVLRHFNLNITLKEYRVLHGTPGSQSFCWVHLSYILFNNYKNVR